MLASAMNSLAKFHLWIGCLRDTSVVINDSTIVLEASDFGQILHVNRNHLLPYTNIGQPVDTVAIHVYHSQKDSPTTETLDVIAKYMQLSSSTLTVYVMNVDPQPNGYWTVK